MADKKIQITDVDSNNLFPITKGAYVTNNSGQALGGVEADAEVNIIETVKVNGTALTPDANRAVDITISSQKVYTIAKDTTAAEGYAATYHLTEDGVNVGEAINIPKDMVVESGTVETCTVADVPVVGYKVGDKYIDLVIANKASSHLYILVTDLIDVYTAGDGIDITNNEISVVTTDSSIADTTPTQNSTKFVQSGGVFTQLALKQDEITSSNKLLSDLVDTTSQTNLFVTATEKSTWNGKQDEITGAATTITANDLTASMVLVSNASGKVAVAADTTATELGYVHGVTSAIQTQLNGKQATVNGAASTIVDDNLTASKVAVSNASGKIEASTVTTTELGYIGGVTSSVQNQLDSKLTYTVINE